jgi:hypothetical protein
MDCVSQSLELLKSRGVGVAINSTSMLKLGAIGDGTAGYRIVATLTGKQRLKTYSTLLLRGGGASPSSPSRRSGSRRR